MALYGAILPHVPWRSLICSANSRPKTSNEGFVSRKLRSSTLPIQWGCSPPIRRRRARTFFSSTAFHALQLTNQMKEARKKSLTLLHLFLQQANSYRQMVAKRIDIEQEKTRESSLAMTAVTEIKREKVLNELRRLELKKYLLKEINSLGKISYEGNNNGEIKKRKVEEMVEELQKLPRVNNGKSRKSDPDDFSSSKRVMLSIDGDWHLMALRVKTVLLGPDDIDERLRPDDIYYLRIKNRTRSQDLIWYFINFPGLETRNIRQKLLHKSVAFEPLESSTYPTLVQIEAEIRLDFLGKLKLILQGTWKSVDVAKPASLTFESLSLQPIELVGGEIQDNFPPLNVPLPLPAFQQFTIEWELLYLDDDLCINKADNEYLLLFERV